MLLDIVVNQLYVLQEIDSRTHATVCVKFANETRKCVKQYKSARNGNTRFTWFNRKMIYIHGRANIIINEFKIQYQTLKEFTLVYLMC